MCTAAPSMHPWAARAAAGAGLYRGAQERRLAQRERPRWRQGRAMAATHPVAAASASEGPAVSGASQGYLRVAGSLTARTAERATMACICACNSSYAVRSEGKALAARSGASRPINTVRSHRAVTEMGTPRDRRQVGKEHRRGTTVVQAVGRANEQKVCGDTRGGREGGRRRERIERN